MTTAARPTYYAAIGKQEYGGFKGRAVCAKDQVGHTKLKYRQIGQFTEDELKNKDFKHELDTKEQQFDNQKNKTMSLILNEEKKIDVTLLIKNQPEYNTETLKKYDDADINENESDDDFDSSRYDNHIKIIHIK